MTEQEYLDQEQYFSESEGRLVDIATLPYKRAAYSYRKCLLAFKDFPGSKLEQAFLAYLEPTPAAMRTLLLNYGAVNHLYRTSTTDVRSKAYSAAKVLGAKIKTHKHEIERGLGWIEVEVVQQSSVRIKGRPVA